MSAVESTLTDILEGARERGFLGPGPVGPHLEHARGFVVAVEQALGRPAGRFCDLGTGGGVPGLVLAAAWPGAAGLLVESNHRRTEALRAALALLEASERVQVAEMRAELAAHVPEFRERFEAVTARSFAEPAVTAEIAAGFAALGGVLVVSEPPGGDLGRWPRAGLEALGFAPARVVSGDAGTFAVIKKVAATAAAVPRPVGRPAKRPRW